MKRSRICCYRHRMTSIQPGVLIRTLFLLAVVSSVASMCPADEIDVWVGTSGSDGIFYLTLDTENGKMSPPTVAAKVDGAGFLVLHPNGQFLYSTAKQNGEGGVAAFEIANGELKPSSFLPTGDGGAACVGVDKTGKVLMSAQYGGGSTSSYTLKPDGSLGERVEAIEHGEGSGAIANRQAKSHPHWVGTSPDNRFLMVPDLGMDRVVVYKLDPATAKLNPHSKVAVPPGSGPRHMKFHTSGEYAYVLNELALTISVFSYDAATGAFEQIQLIKTLAEDLKDKHLNSAAEIRVHPSGRFVYSSNRGHDSISVFTVDPETRKLTFVENEAIRGSWPRNFNVDPTGKWLLAAGQYSNTLSLFEIDQESGELIFTRKVVNVPKPICVEFGS